MNGDAINLMLDTFQELRRRGDQARLFLETRNGEQFGTLQIRIPKGKPGAPNTTHKSKSPSTVRRNQQRMKSFIERKILQESLGSPSARSTPISRPGQTRSSQDIWVTMPVKEALDKDGLEQQASVNCEIEDKEKKHADNETNNDTVNRGNSRSLGQNSPMQ